MGLYRLFVYLGDLYRYNKSFDLAEEAYLSANKLAPGLGQVRSPLLLSSEQKKNIENPMYNILEGPSSFLYRPSHSHVNVLFPSQLFSTFLYTMIPYSHTTNLQ